MSQSIPLSAHRHQCEVRAGLSMRGVSRATVEDYLGTVKTKRGMPAHDRLKADIVEQWQRGNRGNHGDWR